MKRYFQIIFGTIKAEDMTRSDYRMLNLVTIYLSAASIVLNFVIPLILSIF